MLKIGVPEAIPLISVALKFRNKVGWQIRSYNHNYGKFLDLFAHNNCEVMFQISV